MLLNLTSSSSSVWILLISSGISLQVQNSLHVCMACMHVRYLIILPAASNTLSNLSSFTTCGISAKRLNEMERVIKE